MRRPTRSLAAVAAATCVAFLGTAALAPLPERLATPGSRTLRWADGTTAHVFLAEDGRWRVPVSRAQVDPRYIEALLALEDQRFGWHPGVDPVAVGRAAWANARAGHVVSGASTLTQQVVRVLEPRPRTLASKIVEAHRALTLELRLGKARILEAYLTFSPFGRNLEGVEMAARAYFGHGADDLSPEEIAVLLAVPQAPSARHPSPSHAARLRSARDHVLDKLVAAGVFAAAEAEVARTSPVPVQLLQAPRAAPHAARWLAARQPGQGPLESTLDAATQATVERLIDVVSPDRAAQGIQHGTVLVVERSTGAVRAAAGNLSFGGLQGSQIAAFDVPRSPGSTLKPLLYAMALDAGLLLPERLVPDVPVRYGTYAPENYDETYEGVVRMEDALSRSRNVPFVDLLSDLGVDRFVGVLRQLGVTSLIDTPGHYGLSAAVGGLELTAVELAQVYLALLEPQGPPRLAWTRDLLDRPPGVAVVSPEAAWLTRRALQRRDRPDFPSRKDLAALPPEVVWKTGTSFGHRDAWAVGADTSHLVVVWFGNLDQTPSRHLVGADAAGTLLFDMLAGLAATRTRPGGDPAPPGLGPISVCASSGHLPGPACPTRATALAPLASVPADPCPFHLQVEVDAASGLAVTPACRGDRATRLVDVLSWPAEVVRWADARRADLPGRPAWAPGCTPASSGALNILRPAPGEVILLAEGLPADAQQVPLEVTGGLEGGGVSWFVDGALHGRSDAATPQWWTPTPGDHLLVAVADHGATASRRVRVTDAARHTRP